MNFMADEVGGGQNFNYELIQLDENFLDTQWVLKTEGEMLLIRKEFSILWFLYCFVWKA